MTSLSHQKKNNFIHPTAIVHPSLKLGFDNYIGPYCVIGEDVELGDGNRLEAFVSVGTAPEHKSYWSRDKFGGVLIGDHNMIREFVTINAGTDARTTLYSDVIMLRGSHAGHDVRIEDKANISCDVLIGGHSIIMEGANCGLGSVIHQRMVIGCFAMVGMNSTVTDHIKPFSKSFGSPCKPKGVNAIGLIRAGFSQSDVGVAENWLKVGGTPALSPKMQDFTFRYNYLTMENEN